MSEQIKQGMKILSEGEPIKFDIFKEGWNQYIVKHNDVDVEIQGRIVLTKIFKTNMYDEQGQPIYLPAYQNIFSSYAPKQLHGEPSSQIDDKTRITNILEELEFETVKEVWNEYRINDGSILRIKLVVTGVQVTSFYSQDGDPLYNINSQPAIRIIVPPDLIKKPKK